MNLTGILLFMGLLCAFCTASGQSDSIKSRLDSTKSYATARLVGEPPRIDGLASDPAWDLVPWGGGGFRQKFPDAGAPASVETWFKILYDDKNLYILFKNLDPEPSKIAKRMTRRDGFDGDFVEINIDSYADKRTAFSFTASVSGVKGDEYVSNNGDDWDPSWDPIWYLKTSINQEGWIAEMRIPLSQLRFTNKEEHVWGFQVQRQLFRKQELSDFQYIPPTMNGWVHMFSQLHGIKGIKPQKQLEVMPYTVAKAETFQKEDGNPFMTGNSSDLAVGVDAKIGLTSDVTLDLTINPDFGQVEADPSRVNLTAFELFFQERRPFFIEGNNILNFPLREYSDNNLFYSRRIGRQPQIPAATAANEFAQSKTRTPILAAAKVTGKNHKGFSWGIMESVTAAQFATIDSLGERSKQAIEPLTNYFVARAQQDIDKGNTLVGGMFTATNRNIEDSRLQILPYAAYSGGIDVLHNWKNRTYYASGKIFASYVQGGMEAMVDIQRSSERYFQRPDNLHADVDSSRRSMTGTGGTFMVGKRSGKFLVDLGGSWLSPQLNLNDVGYLRQTDQIRQWVFSQYRILNPVGITRSQYYSLYQAQTWDFDGKEISKDYEVNAQVQFKNYWELGAGIGYNQLTVSNADLRGGPALTYPGTITGWLWLNTDRRKKFQMNLNPQWQWGDEDFIQTSSLDLGLIYRPVNAMNITLTPGLSFNRNRMQYVDTGSSGGDPRYVMGDIDQTTFSVSLRLTYMVTPNLSIQYWGQPFGTAGRYGDFKYITDGRAPEYHQRYTPIPSSSMSLQDNVYYVDENNTGTPDYSFAKPDFNFGQFRSNMVIRWEYIPGSVVFLVWTQEMNGAFYDGKDATHPHYSFQFPDQAHNIFLMKFTYRFVL